AIDAVVLGYQLALAGRTGRKLLADALLVLLGVPLVQALAFDRLDVLGARARRIAVFVRLGRVGRVGAVVAVHVDHLGRTVVRLGRLLGLFWGGRRASFRRRGRLCGGALLGALFAGGCP